MKQLGLIIVLLLPILVHAQEAKLIAVSIDASNTQQVISNIGASGCWFAEGIGKYWPAAKRNKIAELLFSRAMDKNGNPLGIGLSAWRFNAGAGTTEQGDSSGIKDFRKRAECFLQKDGSYNWNKQAGYVWFVKEAHRYGVENLILFANSPPVLFTKNGLGYKTEKDYTSNLKEDHYGDYAGFLANIVKHFDKEKIHFNYISPVNEPQWDWSRTFGNADQEGTPWKNEEIHKIVTHLDSALTAKQLSANILLPEAGMLTYLYAGSGHAATQIQTFFGKKDSFYLGNLTHVTPIVAGHSYFTDSPDSNLVSTRKKLADTAAKYGVQYWESEYSMLANGYKEGTAGGRSAMDCALFLSKIIYEDFTAGNAAAWQFWNAFEPGKSDSDTRYYLIALAPNSTHTDGSFTPVKNLWALGHYSLFVRPGMHRVAVTKDDGTGDEQTAQGLMIAAFANETNKKLVVVATNYTRQSQTVHPAYLHFGKFVSCRRYVTTGAIADNMKLYPQPLNAPLILPARSVTTVIYE